MTHDERRRRREALAADVRNGMPLCDACTKHRLSMAHGHSACKEHDVHPPRDRLRQQGRTFAVAGALFDVRRTYDDIASAFNVTKQYVGLVYKACRAAGVPVPVRKRSGK
jgi:hypothetical protein